MALRVIRRSTGNNAFDWMVTSAQIASNVSNMLQFPPTMAATTVLLSILQIIAVSKPTFYPSLVHDLTHLPAC
jgi:hypothetical protein